MNVAKVLDSKAVYHLLATSVASELVDRDMLGNIKMLNVSLTPSVYYVYKSRLSRSLITM